MDSDDIAIGEKMLPADHLSLEAISAPEPRISELLNEIRCASILDRSANGVGELPHCLVIDSFQVERCA